MKGIGTPDNPRTCWCREPCDCQSLDRRVRSIARLVSIAAGSYPLGIGIAYLIEYVRMLT